jgi:hypothetical protein
VFRKRRERDQRARREVRQLQYDIYLHNSHIDLNGPDDNRRGYYEPFDGPAEYRAANKRAGFFFDSRFDRALRYYDDESFFASLDRCTCPCGHRIGEHRT